MKNYRSLIVLFCVAGGVLFYGCAGGGKKYASDFFNQGVVWFQKGEYDRAIDDFTKALEMAPEGRDSYVIYYNRGVAFYKSRNYDRAIQDFDTSLQLTPGQVKTGKYKHEIYDSSMEIKPPPTPRIEYQLFNLYKIRGDAWFYKEAYNQAINDYSMALKYGEQRKELPNVYENRGWAKFEINDFDGAIDDFSSALIIDSKLAQSYFGRARAWAEKGDLNLALRDAWMANKLKPDNREYDDLVFDLRSSRER
jgi:tetratricopeptide (TPR) repeat protein